VAAISDILDAQLVADIKSIASALKGAVPLRRQRLHLSKSKRACWHPLQCLVRGRVSLGHGDRVSRELVQESFLSLRDYRPSIYDRWRPVPGVRGPYHSDQRSWVWSCVVIGVGIAFLLEWMYARRRES
jgi:hypothetical protein